MFDVVPSIPFSQPLPLRHTPQHWLSCLCRLLLLSQELRTVYSTLPPWQNSASILTSQCDYTVCDKVQPRSCRQTVKRRKERLSRKVIKKIVIMLFTMGVRQWKLYLIEVHKGISWHNSEIMSPKHAPLTGRAAKVKYEFDSDFDRLCRFWLASTLGALLNFCLLLFSAHFYPSWLSNFLALQTILRAGLTWGIINKALLTFPILFQAREHNPHISEWCQVHLDCGNTAKPWVQMFYA